MLRRRKKRDKQDAFAATKIMLCGIRDAADAFPPLKSVTAALLIVWEISQVSTHYNFLVHVPDSVAEHRKQSRTKKRAYRLPIGRWRSLATYAGNALILEKTYLRRSKIVFAILKGKY